MMIHDCCCLESLLRGIGGAGAPFPWLDTPASIDQELEAKCCIATLQQPRAYQAWLLYLPQDILH